MNGIYRFIRHSEMLTKIAEGWRYVADLGETHGEWSSLMQWCCGDCGGEYAP